MDGPAPRPGGVPLYRDLARKGEADAPRPPGGMAPSADARVLVRPSSVSDLVSNAFGFGRALAAASEGGRRLRAALQHVALPQRAALTFSLSVLRPTAPTTTSLPTT